MVRCVMAQIDVVKNLQAVLERVHIAYKQRPVHLPAPRLVAVSKTKPKELVIAAYEAGQRHFGENYVQELVEKGNDAEILQNCSDIHWHFIGNLQSNKVKKVVSVPGIYLIETVDSVKLAEALNSSWKKLNKETKLKIFVQVNTSGEQAKNGCNPDEAVNLVEYIINSCSGLQFSGLMTIGRFGYDITKGPNPDFLVLKQVQEDVSRKTGLKIEEIELSMGMSDDFEHAIELGSTNVRVGSSLFGARSKKASES